MIDFCTKNKGAISVFLTLILLPTILFGGVVIDGTRIYGSKNIVSGAGDLAMNAALAGYDASLNDAYGLIAMSKTPEELEANLQSYFVDTLNANGLTEDDMARAIIYVDLLDDASFTAQGVPETEIYETEVLKQQILEHMKYRAPVLMIENGMLDRLNELKNMEAEQKAVQSQMDFESEISDLVELFEDLDKQIRDERFLYEDTLGETVGISMRLGEIRSIYQDMSMLTIAHQRVNGCQEEESKTKKELIRWCNSLTRDLSELTDSVEIDTYLKNNFESILKVKKIKNSVTDPEEVYRDLDRDDDEYEEWKAEVEEYNESNRLVGQILENEWKARANKDTKRAQQLTTMAINGCDIGITYCNDMLDSIQKIKEKMEELKGDYDKWKRDVGNISNDSSNKKEYQKSLEEYKEFFDDEQYFEAFVQKVENNKLFYENVKKLFDDLTFTGAPIKDISACTHYMGEAGAYTGSIKTYNELKKAGERFMERYVGEKFLPADTVYADLTPENDELVKRIREYWVKEGEVVEAEAEAEGTKHEDSLLNAISTYTTLITTKDISGENIKEKYVNEIPSVWLGVATPADVGGGGDVSISGNPHKKDDRKKITKDTSKAMDEGTNTVSGISRLGSMLQGAAESAYITEYVVDMFSYYTCNWTGDKSETEGYVSIPDPKSLSDISLKDNTLYRAEVEYIIWGDPETRDNVRNTKAVIFALHLAANAIYATANLSDDASRMALTIVPPGPWHTVVTIALISIATVSKSADDLNRLMHGEGVELYKSKTSLTWPTLFTWYPDKERKAFQFTYRDYLWLLLMINMVQGDAKQRGILARTADCIELNMTKGKSEMDASLRDKYTMVQIDADVLTSTFFLQKISTVSDEAPEMPLNGFTFHYTGRQGY